MSASLLAALATAAAVATWPFEPPPDRFSPSSLLDLRSLNEREAGATGFVRADGDGGFVRGDGQPPRFWAVTSEVGRHPFVATPLGPKSAPDVARHARFLAKRGVNLVRLHRQISPDQQRDPTLALDAIDRAERDAVWRAVAAFKREGIYTMLSPYWAGAARLASASGLVTPASPQPWGLLFFEPQLQRAYRAWLRELLLPPNPYTGVPLAREPALAVLQLQNEDSLLFWTVDRIGGASRVRLEQRFASFLAQREGRDAAPGAREALLPMWELAREQSGANARRAAAQTEFLARTMHDFNAATLRWLRDEIGLRALVNAGSWKSASAAHLGDAERWSYLPGEVDAVNVYTHGPHLGAHAGWAIVPGDRYANLSVLDRPDALPLAIKQSVDARGLRPMLVSEGNWVPPNLHAAEGPWLVAALGAASGLAGYTWFASGDEGWSAPASANGHLPSLAKWVVATPERLGSFPAAAWLYRQGLVPRAAPAATIRRTLPELWQRRVPTLVEPASFDPNRDVGAPQDGGAAGVLPFWRGPVRTLFGDAAAPPSRAQATDAALRFDAPARSVRLDAPSAQGVTAFFATTPRHRLADLEVESGNDYGALLAIALDGAPLRTSRRVLVQYVTRSRPTGWRETPLEIELDGGRRVPGFRIDDIGRAPWQVEQARLSLKLRNAVLRRARVLDMNGEPIGELSITREGESLSLRFPPRAMYVVLD